ncbi:MAG TPA: dipeptidase, partial [Planctomycetota bacterium]|nr:dipeptidase [Planctomycetota bacterium]
PIAAVAIALFGCHASAPESAPAPAEDLAVRAQRLAREFLIVDTHIDVPYRLHAQGAERDDVSRRTAGGHFDFERARAGGLDAAFMSIYIPAELQERGGGKALADELIDLVEGLAAAAPERFEVARSADDVERIAAAGKVALPLGIENGAALEDQLANVAHFARRGVRYVTLTHSADNLICDSSYADTRTWGGLSPFGREVVRELNRQGVMVDVSHVSDATFDDVLELSSVPPIASHSSCRAFVPGFERNLDDERIARLGAAGGVLQINFGSAFLTAEANAYLFGARGEVERLVREAGHEPGSDAARELARAWYREHPPVGTLVSDVADHIDHAVALAGVEHVGLGSDFDGVGSVPVGLDDVACYPALVEELLRRGYGEDELRAILGGNVLRVWRQAEAYAAAHAN